MSRITRLEKKFLIDEERAEAIRHHIAPICDEDPVSSGPYTIHSLYLDTPALDFYDLNHTKQQHRIKPRARYYGLVPRGHLVLEVKRKSDDLVIKTRRVIDCDSWPGVLDEAVGADPFLDLVQGTGALPMVHVRYERHAFVSGVDPYARVTFDRGLRAAAAWGDPALYVPDEAMTTIDDPFTTEHPRSPIILELKCESLIPRWMAELPGVYDLTQRGFSKYCAAIERLGLAPAPLDRF